MSEPVIVVVGHSPPGDGSVLLPVNDSELILPPAIVNLIGPRFALYVQVIPRIVLSEKEKFSAVKFIDVMFGSVPLIESYRNGIGANTTCPFAASKLLLQFVIDDGAMMASPVGSAVLFTMVPSVDIVSSTSHVAAVPFFMI